VQLAVAALAGSVMNLGEGQKLSVARGSGAGEMRMGQVVWVSQGQTVDAVVREVRDAELSACQIGFDGLSLTHAEPLRAALDKYGIEGTAISEHNPGVRIFDFYEGPRTIGIIPRATRKARIAALKTAADVAHAAGIPAIHSHLGFIPEDPSDALYPEAVAAVKEVAAYCKSLGISLLCETGQETPITMVRLIDDVGLGNVFVNLDVANLILYGKGNPVDAMDVLGERVRGVHAKDGHFPTSTRKLGQEVRMGEGRVDFSTLLRRLKQVNYGGTLLLEIESGSEDERKHNLIYSRDFLARLLAATYSEPTA
jgi:sugar phosphate isomerase/epimerase